MKMTTRHREAEIALGARSRHKAEAELKVIDSARFSASITEFIEWRTFAYWVRLAVESEGGIAAKIQARLDERCPGTVVALNAYLESHPEQRDLVWLRLIRGSITTSSGQQTRRDGGMPSAFMP